MKKMPFTEGESRKPLTHALDSVFVSAVPTRSALVLSRADLTYRTAHGVKGGIFSPWDHETNSPYPIVLC